jgi:phosphoribosylformimino-5-aminoimidazole carboxamide ribonucleotide (ProFAR) isomerase
MDTVRPHVLLVEGRIVDEEVERLAQLLERIREKIYTSLDAARGNQQDPEYQRWSNEFDQALVQYMRVVANGNRN